MHGAKRYQPVAIQRSRMTGDIDWKFLYFEKEKLCHDYINKEWIATKRAMAAERKIRELQDKLREALDNGIDADV